MRHDPADWILAAYVDWREACLRVRETYDVWTGGPRVAGAFSAYVCALDREEQAAWAYAGSLERAARIAVW